MCISTLIYNHPRPFSGWTLQWIAGWNAHHLRQFTEVVNTISSPIRVKGVWWWGATKWRDHLIQENLNGQMTSVQAVFSSTYHKM